MQFIVIIAGILAGAAQAQLPAGFFEKVIASKDTFSEATSMAHADDGRIFVSERAGDVKLIVGDSSIVIHHINTTIEREQGLLKIQAHPNFAQKSWLYCYYTTADYDHHKIIRLRLGANNQVTQVDTIVRLPHLENQGRHNGSAMVFDNNGLLYVGRGQDELTGSGNPATLWTSQKGKILRFTAEGLPAPGNPHYSTPGATDAEKSVWARGFRNPWTFGFDPISGRILAGDVGDSYEEVNDITAPDAGRGYTYGYGASGGDGVNPSGGNNTIDPIYYHSTGGECAIVAEAPYNSAFVSNWPVQYKGKIYVADYCNNAIRTLPLANPSSPINYNSGNSGMQLFYQYSKTKVGLYVGIDGNLYYVEYGAGGQAYMIYYKSPTSGEAAASGRLGARGIGNRLGRAANLSFTLTGEFTRWDVAQGTFVIAGPDGRTHFRKQVEIRGNTFQVEGFKPSGAGLYFCELRWASSGVRHRSTGRLAVLP